MERNVTCITLATSLWGAAFENDGIVARFLDARREGTLATRLTETTGERALPAHRESRQADERQAGHDTRGEDQGSVAGHWVEPGAGISQQQDGAQQTAAAIGPHFLFGK